jgi:chromosomal replication initiation ATPase DnaA
VITDYQLQLVFAAVNRAMGTHFTLEELQSGSRHVGLVQARALFAYLARRYTLKVWWDIAEYARGSRGRHSSMVEAHRKVVDAMAGRDAPAWAHEVAAVFVPKASEWLEVRGLPSGKERAA